MLRAQEPTEPASSNQTAPAKAPIQLATVHGEVRNAATGLPLPRALVRLEGDANTGALTDGTGRFEIPGVPVGPQAIQVLKPGFRDRPYAAGAAAVEETVGPAHNVLVAKDMPDLVFTLAPTCSIHGQIELSTGDPAQGIGVQLIHRTVQDGRAVWQLASSTKTNSEGAYRFAGLADGLYAIFTDPAMDSDSVALAIQAGRGAAVTRDGYPSVFFPGAADLAGAAKISLANGDQAQANLALTLEHFHTVTATVVAPPGKAGAEAAKGPAGASGTYTLMDTAGHTLSYNALYDQTTNTIQATLPDGLYTLVAWFPQAAPISGAQAGLREGSALAGSVDFSVEGHAVTNLRIPLSVQPANSIQVTVIRSGEQADAGKPGELEPISVMASQTGGWINDGMTTPYAEKLRAGTNATNNLPPGAYWLRSAALGNGLCEQSFTAAGADLAREPLVLSLSATAPAMELILRDDCAKLTLTLPEILYGWGAGEEPFYTVYVVPDFETTVGLGPVTLRPSTGGTFTLAGLTPGSYHVYTFAAPVRLEYHNAAVLAALPAPGQQVTLSPGGTGNLVLEAPGR